MATKNRRVRAHEFVLVLSGLKSLSPAVMDALFEAGCGDATPSIRLGRIYLAFARESASLKDAVLSAIDDVKRARVGAEILYVDASNLVSQADIARRIKRTRQQVGQYIAGTRGPGHFPGPVCGLAERHPLWQWCEVADWLWQNGIVDDEVLSESRLIAAVNSVLDLLHQQAHGAALVEKILRHASASAPKRKTKSLPTPPRAARPR